jgi:hypothetical protein
MVQLFPSMIRTYRADKQGQTMMTNPVEWALLDHQAQEPVRIGDMVSADAGGLPIYWVVGLEDGLARLADEHRAAAGARPLAGFRWRGVES